MKPWEIILVFAAAAVGFYFWRANAVVNGSPAQPSTSSAGGGGGGNPLGNSTIANDTVAVAKTGASTGAVLACVSLTGGLCLADDKVRSAAEKDVKKVLTLGGLL